MADTTTILCGSLSLHPVSTGARMHRAGYADLGLDYAYVPFKCEDLPGALAGMRALGIRGFGVSMPFKQRIMALLDEIDPLAARIGAVNTVVNDAGRLTGFNTDALGAVRALSEVVDPKGRRVLVLGAGGAARAVVYGLMDAGAAVRIANRTEARAQALAEEVTAATGSAVGAAALGDLGGLGDADIVVNATSAGMAEYGAESPVDPRWIRPDLVVMDIVYKPMRTRLVAAAEAAGARTVHGGRMLLHQACGQFELYTGHPAPLQAMNRALRSALAASPSVEAPKN